MAEGSAAPSGLLQVASYNIRRCRGNDGRRDPARIARVLAALDADVIGLQEVDAGGELELQELARKLGYGVVEAPTRTRRGGATGNALLTRLPVGDVRRLDLSVRRREPRGALDVDLELRGASVRVVVTHLGLSSRERLEQVKHLVAARSSRHALEILLGDFNEWRLDGRLARIVHARFGEARAVPTFPAWWPILPLDRIWVSPRERLVAFHSVDGPVTRRASDHLPVRAAISLEGLPSESGLHRGASTLDDVDHEHRQRDQEQDVDEAAQRVRAHQA